MLTIVVGTVGIMIATSKLMWARKETKGDAAMGSDIDLYIDTNGKLRGLGFVDLLVILINILETDVDLILFFY